MTTDKRWRDIPLRERAEGAVKAALIGVGLILLSFLFSFIIDHVLEEIYGAEALHFMSMTQPQHWLLLNKVFPIFHILVILVLSLPLWKNYPKEKMHAAIFFSATMVFYLLWGFVLSSAEGIPSVSRSAQITGASVIFFIPLYHSIILNRRSLLLSHEKG
jgi:phosphoglycerol transferase MdoB-like AlkP superfamily enzyme